MFKQYLSDLTENLASIDPDVDLDDNITKADLIEIINDLDEDEYYPIMEILLSYIENTFDVDDIDGDGTEDIDETLDEELSEADKLSEAKYFANKASQMKRNKKKNKTDKRKLAKKRKMAYKKNKAKAKRYRKKAARKKKSGKTVGGKRITKHR